MGTYTTSLLEMADAREIRVGKKKGADRRVGRGGAAVGSPLNRAIYKESRTVLFLGVEAKLGGGGIVINPTRGDRSSQFPYAVALRGTSGTLANYRSRENKAA